MSQVKKPAVEKRILKAAKLIFLKYGFINASLRDIAKHAKVALSNLYNYFPDKNAIFVAVLKPELDDLEKLCEFGRTHRRETTPFESLKEKKQYLRIALDYINLHRQELNLLFNQSFGSSLENYTDYLAQQYETNWNHLFIDLKKNFLINNFANLHPFFFVTWRIFI